MTRWLVIGATGGVGRELSPRLASSASNAVILAGRNRVLLEEMGSRLECEFALLDLSSQTISARDLPAAEVVVDLTNAVGKHPRAVVRQAERTVAVLTAYLQLHPTARVVHTATWVVPHFRDTGRQGLSLKLAWDDAYLLGKTAAERAIARSPTRARMDVVRLGNMMTGDTLWGSILLRALRVGTVANPEALSRAANLTSVSELADRAAEGCGGGVTQTNATAGFSWAEVLAAVAERLDVPTVYSDLPLPFRPGSTQEPVGRSRRRPGALVRRGLWFAPLRIETLKGGELPLPERVLATARSLLQPAGVSALERLPPALPALPRMPNAGRDAAALEVLVDDVARPYGERGYDAGDRLAAEPLRGVQPA